QRVQGGPLRLGRGGFLRRRGEGGRDEQRLRLDAARGEARFQALVDDAFVRRMHVDDHQALVVFGEHVDAGDLRDGATERPVGVVGQRRRGDGGGWVPRRCLFARVEEGGLIHRGRR